MCFSSRKGAYQTPATVAEMWATSRATVTSRDSARPAPTAVQTGRSRSKPAGIQSAAQVGHPPLAPARLEFFNPRRR